MESRNEKTKKGKLDKTNMKLLDVVNHNQAERLNEFTALQLLDFVAPITGQNIFLFAVHGCKVKTAREIVRIVKEGAEKKVVRDFLKATDFRGRNALFLATLADDGKMLGYLVQTLGFEVNRRNNRGESALTVAIDRNKTGAFDYLLLHGAEFGDQEETAVSDSSNTKFKEYFNSPACFLVIIGAKNRSAFCLIMRHIITQSDHRQAKFTSAVDQHGRDALILAAFTDQQRMVADLLGKLRFDWDRHDADNNRAIFYLSFNGRTNLALKLIGESKKLEESEAYMLEDSIDEMRLSTKTRRKEIGNLFTNRPGGDQQGALPITITDERRRPYRSFKKEREKQLLRQVATQLYFALDKKLKEDEGSGLVEVQIMHMEFNGKHSLFIVANQHTVSSALLELIENDNVFRELLGTVYSPRGGEGKIRSERYAAKLTQRVLSDTKAIIDSLNETDKYHVNEVADLLRTGNVLSFPIKLDGENSLLESSKNEIRHVLTKKAGGIYIVNVKACANKLRHAEEFLSDIAEHAHDLAKKLGVEIYTSVAGKKRPCMGCSGRMDGIIGQFGKRPGRFWLNTIENQSEDAAARTVRMLLKRESFVTVGRDGAEDRAYDSGSDSEAEEKKVSSKSSAKARRLGG